MNVKLDPLLLKPKYLSLNHSFNSYKITDGYPVHYFGLPAAISLGSPSNAYAIMEASCRVNHLIRHGNLLLYLDDSDALIAVSQTKNGPVFNSIITFKETSSQNAKISPGFCMASSNLIVYYMNSSLVILDFDGESLDATLLGTVELPLSSSLISAMAHEDVLFVLAASTNALPKGKIEFKYDLLSIRISDIKNSGPCELCSFFADSVPLQVFFEKESLVIISDSPVRNESIATLASTMESKNIEEFKDIVESNVNEIYKGIVESIVEDSNKGGIGSEERKLESKNDEPYIWTQSGTEVTIYIQLPSQVQKKQIHIHFGKDTLTVKSSTYPEPIMKGSLFDAVHVDECLWTLDDGQLLTIYLEKANTDMRWVHVF